MKNNLLLGSGNPGKIKEIKFYLEYFNLFTDRNIIDLSNFSDVGEPEENGSTFEENSIIKSNFFFKKTNCLTLSDDSGFIVEEMENFPGVKTARVAKEMGGEQKVVDYIFSKKTKKQKISATFYCSLSLVGQKINNVVTGKISGFIIPHKKGNDGFGYDPFFIPLHSKKTFAEMGNNQKMKLSHRFEAFKILSTIQK
ncbi:MAG: non-canonical purine NTP pyrophosphatase [Proteobacteria bacterium]|nr:non-canonical purine NTP pyrophosphatase [Pseudomonadota bacterium]